MLGLKINIVINTLVVTKEQRLQSRGSLLPTVFNMETITEIVRLPIRHAVFAVAVKCKKK
jgi:hypothetical protein